MNNFIYENKTKVYFGKGCVKEYLTCLLKQYGNNVMFAYGGGSVKEKWCLHRTYGVFECCRKNSNGIFRYYVQSHLYKGTGRGKARL